MSDIRVSPRVALAALPVLVVGLWLGLRDNHASAERTVVLIVTDSSTPQARDNIVSRVTSGRLVRADGIAEMPEMVALAAAPPPSVQESLQKIQQSLEKLESVTPTTEETLREYRDLGKSLRDALKEAGKTNEELQKLIKSINETMPTARTTIEEVGTLSRNWARLGERANVLLQTNEEVIQKTLRNTEKATEGIAETFNQENRTDLTNLIRNLSTASRRMPKLTEETERFFRDSQDTVRKLNGILDQVGGTAAGEDGQSMIKELRESSVKLNRLLSDVREIVQVAGRSDGSLRRFLTDPALFNHLDDAALMITRTIPRVDRVLKDLEVFADKLARHPESIGLGGVVRPSAGLKEPPTRSYPYPGQVKQP